MSDEETTLNSKVLDDFVKAMKEKAITAKVGILGQKNARNTTEKGGSTSNATIGAAHEFGSSKLPQRSFLRMPISEKLPKAIEASNIFGENNLKEIIKSQSFEKTVEQIAIMGVEVVLEAFDTGGFGTWPALSQARIKQRAKLNQGNQILVVPDSHQLRDSISYEINKS